MLRNNLGGVRPDIVERMAAAGEEWLRNKKRFWQVTGEPSVKEKAIQVLIDGGFDEEEALEEWERA